MKGPWCILLVEGSLHIFHFLWPDPNEYNYWLYFFILCNKNGIKGLWGDKGRPHGVQDPPWSFNGPYHGPTIHQTWPFIYWLYFCILCNKNRIKGLWGHKGWPQFPNGGRTHLGPSKDPAMALKYTQQGPLYIGYIFAFEATKIWSRDSGDTKVDPHWV